MKKLRFLLVLQLDYSAGKPEKEEKWPSHTGVNANGTESKQVPALIPLLRLQMTPENSNYLVFLLKELTEASLATSN